MIILDTDILSMFAKIGEIELLKCLFSEEVAMVPKVRDEISIPQTLFYPSMWRFQRASFVLDR